MEIIRHGLSCFEIRTKGQKILVDPYDPQTAKLPNTSYDVVIISSEDDKHLEGIKGEPRVFDWPGEYEIEGIFVEGFEASYKSDSEDAESEPDHKPTVFVVHSENINLCSLSNLNRMPSDGLLEKMGNIDILLVPVGGGKVMDARLAREITETIDPRIVIPIYYQEAGIQAAKLAPVTEFVKEISAVSKPEKSLKIAHKDMPNEGMQVSVLEK